MEEGGCCFWCCVCHHVFRFTSINVQSKISRCLLNLDEQAIFNYKPFIVTVARGKRLGSYKMKGLINVFLLK